MITTYINTFYQKYTPCSSEHIATNETPREYKGYKIYHRVKSNQPGGNIYDVVKDGKCIGMYAGFNGAKSLIDAISNIS